MDTRDYLTALAVKDDALLKPIMPSRITLSSAFTVNEWATIIRDELVPRITRQLTYSRSSRGRFDLFDGRLHVLYTLSKGKVGWFLKEGGTTVGAGTLKHFPDDRLLSEDRVAIFPERLRGKRIYPRILRKLAASLGVGVDSDTTFIGTSILSMWKRTGVFLPERGRFHIRRRNPEVLSIVNHWPFDAQGVRSFLSRMATDPVGRRSA